MFYKTTVWNPEMRKKNFRFEVQGNEWNNNILKIIVIF